MIEIFLYLDEYERCLFFGWRSTKIIEIQLKPLIDFCM